MSLNIKKLALKSFIKKIFKLCGWNLIKFRKPPEPNPYGKINFELLKKMNDCKGILHLGAHRGTEAEVYNWFGKKAIWVEASPFIFNELKENLFFYKNQIPLQALLSDVDNEELDFYISNNDGACSSISNFTDEINKSVIYKGRNFKMLKKIKLKSCTLDTLFKKNNIIPSNYDHWIIDLQGAELKTLKGSTESIKNCKSILIEVSKKKFYQGSALWHEVKEWLEKKGFVCTKEIEKDEEDILFVKK